MLPREPPASGPLTVRLRAENHSGVTGRARLRRRGGGFTVALRLPSRKVGHQAHIHDVTCAEYRRIRGFDEQLATVAQPLSDPSSGRSSTAVRRPLSAFRGGYSINVHADDARYTVVACGDMPG